MPLAQHHQMMKMGRAPRGYFQDRAECSAAFLRKLGIKDAAIPGTVHAASRMIAERSTATL